MKLGRNLHKTLSGLVIVQSNLALWCGFLVSVRLFAEASTVTFLFYRDVSPSSRSCSSREMGRGSFATEAGFFHRRLSCIFVSNMQFRQRSLCWRFAAHLRLEKLEPVTGLACLHQRCFNVSLDVAFDIFDV